MTKHLITLSTALLLLSLSTGCILTPPEENNANQNNQNQTQNNQNWEVKDANLKATFVSGNLGSYYDCPDKGHRAASNTQGAPQEKAAPGLMAGDCAADTECGLLNCSDAQLTLRLNNDGAVDGRNIRIKAIQLLDKNKMVKTTFPILGTFDATKNEAFDGNLEAGKTLNIRVDFTGPKSVSEFLGDDSNGSDNRFGAEQGARLRVIIESDTHEKIEFDTKEVHPIGLVVT